MGEPITVYDKNGKPLTVHGRAYADGLIAAGEATAQPKDARPAPTAAIEEAPQKPRRKGAA